MKSLIISLIILLPGGKTDLKDIEIFDSSCYTWYQQNVRWKKEKLLSLVEDLIIYMMEKEL